MQKVILTVILSIIISSSVFASEQIQYFAVLMGNKKIGHSISRRLEEDNKVTTTDETTITISRRNVPVTIKTSETSVETADGRPLGFSAVRQISDSATQIEGLVNSDGMVKVNIHSAGGDQQKSFQWPEGAVMAEGLKLLMSKKGLEEGTSCDVKVFSPSLMQAADEHIEIGPTEQVNLLGASEKLTEITSEMVFPQGNKIYATNFMDQQFRMKKNIMPFGRTTIEMIACQKDFALSSNEPAEIFINSQINTTVASPEPLGDLSRAESVSYEIVPKDKNRKLMIPETDSQKVRQTDDGLVVTVRPLEAEKGTGFPYRGMDTEIFGAVRPTEYVQSNNPKIVEIARKTVKDINDAAEAVEVIESFTADYIEKRSLAVGYASAVEVLKNKEGDCTEFAVLTAAMCRAVGIPARIVTGLVYVDSQPPIKQQFIGHAWTQVYIGSQWVDVDTALKTDGRSGFDAGHIALATGNGEATDFFAVINLLGQFEIKQVKINLKKSDYSN